MQIKNRADWRNSKILDLQLGVPRLESDRDICYPHMLRGFSYFLEENSGTVLNLVMTASSQFFFNL